MFCASVVLSETTPTAAVLSHLLIAPNVHFAQGASHVSSLPRNGVSIDATSLVASKLPKVSKLSAKKPSPVSARQLLKLAESCGSHCMDQEDHVALHAFLFEMHVYIYNIYYYIQYVIYIYICTDMYVQYTNIPKKKQMSDVGL